MVTLQLKQFKQVIETVDSVEIEVPAFYELGGSVVKILEQDHLEVNNTNGIKCMRISSNEGDSENLRMFIKYGRATTEEKFNEAYCNLHNEMAEMQLSNKLKVTA